MAIALDIAMAVAMAKLHHFYKLENVFTLTRVGEYRKIPVFGLRSSLGNSLNLMLVFPCTPLLSSMYRLSTIKYSTLKYTTLMCTLRKTDRTFLVCKTLDRRK